MFKNKIRDLYLHVMEKVNRSKKKKLDKLDAESNGKMFNPRKLKSTGLIIFVGSMLAIFVFSFVTDKMDYSSFDASKKEFDTRDREVERMNLDKKLIQQREKEIREANAQINNTNREDFNASKFDENIVTASECYAIFEKIKSFTDLSAQEKERFEMCKDQNPSGLSKDQLKAMEMLANSKDLTEAEKELLLKMANGDIVAGSLEEELLKRILNGEKIPNLEEILNLPQDMKDQLAAMLRGELTPEQEAELLKKLEELGVIPLIDDVKDALGKSGLLSGLSNLMKKAQGLSAGQIEAAMPFLNELDPNEVSNLIQEGIKSGAIGAEALAKLSEMGVLNDLSPEQKEGILRLAKEQGILGNIYDFLPSDMKEMAKDLFGKEGITSVAKGIGQSLTGMADNLLGTFSDLQKLMQNLKELCAGKGYEKIVSKLEKGDVLDNEEFKIHEMCTQTRAKIREKTQLLTKLEKDFSLEASTRKNDLYSSQKSIETVYGDALSSSQIEMVECRDIKRNEKLIKDRYFIPKKNMGIASSAKLLKNKLLSKAKKIAPKSKKAQEALHGKAISDMTKDELKDLISDSGIDENFDKRDDFAFVDPSSVGKDGEQPSATLSALSVFSKDPNNTPILPPGVEMQAALETDVYISDNVKGKRVRATITRDIRHPKTGEIVVPEGTILMGKTTSLSVEFQTGSINFNYMRIGGETKRVSFNADIKGKAWDNRLSQIAGVLAAELAQTVVNSIGVLGGSDEAGDEATLASEILSGVVGAGQATTQSLSEFLVKDIESSEKVFFTKKNKMILIYSN